MQKITLYEFLRIIEKGEFQKSTSDYWLLPSYLLEWLGPVEIPSDIKERKILKFEGNELVNRIAYFLGIPPSIIIDTYERGRKKNE